MPYGRFRRHRRNRFRSFKSRFRFRGLRRFVKRTVARMAETKIAFANVNVANLRSNNTSVTSFVSGLATGVGPFNRVGDKIQLKRISWRVMLRFLPGSIPDALVRITVVYPRKNITDLDLSSLNTVTVNSSYDPQLVYVIRDTTVGMGAQTVVNPDMPAQRLIRGSKWMKNMVIRYPSATINDIQREPLIVISTNVPVGDLSSIQVFLETRMSYIDL